MAGILVAYEDPLVRTGLRQLLEHAQHRVGEVESCADALQLLRTHPVDIFITELSTPEDHEEISVEDFLNQFPKVKIIATTSGQTTRTAWLPLAQKLGNIQVLRRPFTNDQILWAIQELLKAA